MKSKRIMIGVVLLMFACCGCGRKASPPAEEFFPKKLAPGPVRTETITVVLFENLPMNDILLVMEAVSEVFGFRAGRSGDHEIPQGSQERDGSVDARLLLEHLVDVMPLDSVRVLGLTKRALVSEEGADTLGMGQVEGKAALVSVYEVARAFERQVAAGGDADRERALYRSRLRKLACHELAHTFLPSGFVHCETKGCLLAPVELGLEDLDRAGDFCPECRGRLAEAVAGPVNTPVTYYHLGIWFEDRGNPERAVQAYEMALRGDPGMAAAHNNLGAVHLKAGRRERALEEFQKAVDADPGYSLALLNLGRALAAEGRNEEALGAFSRCLETDASMTAAWKDGGFLLRDACGEPERAEHWFRKYVEAGGRNEEIEHWLAGRGGGNR